jgi:hypothetical protein
MAAFFLLLPLLLLLLPLTVAFLCCSCMQRSLMRPGSRSLSTCRGHQQVSQSCNT